MAASNTRSIDVGSMFLMDLSVSEAEASGALDEQNAELFSSRHQQPNKLTHSIDSYKTRHHLQQQLQKVHNNNHYHNSSSRRDALQTTASESSSANNSLDRLTNLIHGKPINAGFIIGGEPESISSSLSDGHFGRSSTVTSSSGASSCNEAAQDLHSLGSQSSFGDSCSDLDNINQERASTTTREDSGVLDMKDLVGSQKSQPDCSPYEEDDDHDDVHDEEKSPARPNPDRHDNTQISTNIKATNLINSNKSRKAAYRVPDNSYATTTTFKPATNPTKLSNINNINNNSNSHHQHHHHHHNNHHSSNQGSKRSVSASLPIEVPTRQIKKNLNKLKLKLISQNNTLGTPVAAPAAGQEETAMDSAADCQSDDCVDDFDDFLDQEYNDNHHKHYPVNEHEHFRADEDPMKLFESIQALARSLHEDAELFGSLPPKRMLESPIRSLALV